MAADVLIATSMVYLVRIYVWTDYSLLEMAPPVDVSKEKVDVE